MENHGKVGWRVAEWATAIGISRAFAYELLEAAVIASVKIGAARVITTHPADYLATLAAAEPPKESENALTPDLKGEKAP